MENSLLNSIRQFDNSELSHAITVEHGGIVVNSNEAPKVGHDSDAEIKEYFDDEDAIRAQAKELATLLRGASHAVVYTGAGISTAAKIPDYRGPKGIWTLQDRGLQSAGGLTIAQAVPTFAHMALSLLYNKGIIKYVVSTNVDGLHRRSGLPVKGLAELHGNCYKEYCKGCSQEYLRDFDCTSNGCRKDHSTGRNCDKCQEGLLDSIIHFGETLPESEFAPATDNAQKADLALVLGTSMKVQPACRLPPMCLQNKGKLVICNLQKTPCDQQASLLMHAPTDIVMYMLMEELGLLSEISESTPEGFPIVRPPTYNPKELREKAEQQLQQLAQSNEGKVVTRKLATVNLPLKARPTEQVTNKKGETSTIACQRNQVLFIRECSDSVLTVQDPSMKVVVERLQSTTLNLNGSITTGTCEIISCQNSTIIFATEVPTITVDKCTNCTIAFAGHSIPQFIWSNCSKLTFRVGTQEYIIPEAKQVRADVDTDIAQFRTRRFNGPVTTELIIREGAGYATTEAEKRIHDENDRRNEALFRRAMGSMGIADKKQVTLPAPEKK